MMRATLRCGLLLLAAATVACGGDPGREPAPPAAGTDMNAIAERYVKLVLALGRHDPDYVDAYYGPPEWKQEAESTKETLDALAERVAATRALLPGPDPQDQAKPSPTTDSAPDDLSRLRRHYLDRQLSSMAARIRMLKGERLSFDEESRALYDAVAPTHPAAHFQRIVESLDRRFPGKGPLSARYEAWRKPFVIPPDRLDAVFRTAIAACRERTVKHVTLPPGEQFTVEYVKDKPWSGYNWYQGNYRSLIQVNTDLPIYIDRAIDLACHEGYPGHHVYNALLEKHLVRDRGWVEFSAYPLFSPQSLIAEGTANFGIDVAFPGAERVAFEEKVLFPAAGLDPATAGNYYEVLGLVEELGYAGNEAARQYLEGRLDAAGAAAWLERYELYSPERAKQRIRFIDKYRSYVINYNLGKDMVRRYIESRGGTEAAPDRRWAIFEALLSSPRLPSGLE